MQGQGADGGGGQPHRGVRHGTHQDLQVSFSDYAAKNQKQPFELRKKTKLVPRLVASQECVDVPKEICARSKINPRRVRKPAIQRWCYKTEDGDNGKVSPRTLVKV